MSHPDSFERRRRVPRRLIGALGTQAGPFLRGAPHHLAPLPHRWSERTRSAV